MEKCQSQVFLICYFLLKPSATLNLRLQDTRNRFLHLFLVSKTFQSWYARLAFQAEFSLLFSRICCRRTHQPVYLHLGQVAHRTWWLPVLKNARPRDGLNTVSHLEQINSISFSIKALIDKPNILKNPYTTTAHQICDQINHMRSHSPKMQATPTVSAALRFLQWDFPLVHQAIW